MTRARVAALAAPLFSALVVTFLLTVANAASQTSGMPIGNVKITTATGVHTFTVERAETPEHKARGLMHRRHMKADHGMLFTWSDERNASMWMSNTVIPLDMIFIKKDGRVHRVHANTVPFSETIIEAGALVVRVLELNAGTAARIGLKPGDTVELK